MGQTLTHGIYLPDEGERNCYNGLAANWQLLDNSVGTIAEHTSQIAGKAPLVHTHTKADITDFPALATVATSGSYNDLSNIPASFTPASHTHGNLTNDGKVGTTANVPLITGTGGVVQAGSFGTAANTFCEGNDSRLSDARTPVAHTHVTADVTDLLNSAHEWTDTQTYSAASYGQKILLKNTGLDLSVSGNTGLSSTYQHVISWVDKNNTMYSSIQSWASDANNTLVLRSYYRTDANTSRNLSVRFVNTATDKSIYSETNADTNLGTSTNQWNNLYAKNYYYNGVAWGLDKSNVWSKLQNFTGEYLGNEFSGNYYTCFGMYGRYDTPGKSGMFFTKYRPYKAQGSLVSSDIIQYGVDVLENEVRTNNVFDLQASGYDSNTGKFTKIDVVSGLSDANLGTSTNKWKTLNGTNPGALSLPIRGYNDSIALDTTDWGYAGNGFIISMTDNNGDYIPGWVLIVAEDVGDVSDFIKIRLTSYARSPGLDFTTFYTGSQYNIKACFPTAGIGYLVLKLTNGASCIKYARYYPCLGNG